MIYRYKNIDKLKKELTGKKIVFVTGCFDLLHKGHLDHLYSASKFGDVLVVGVLPDKYIRTFKHRDPVNTQLERAQILNALKPVSHVILTSFMNDQRASIKVLKKLQPHIFFHQGKNIYKSIELELKELGIIVKENHLKKANSTSRLINKAYEIYKEKR